VRNIFSGLYWVLIISFLILSCILAILVGTPEGASFLVQKSIEISGQKIYVNHLDGSIVGRLKASSIIFSNDNLELQLQDVEFDPSFSALLRKEFTIKKLKAGLINVSLPVRKEATKNHPETKKPPELSSPLKVNIESLEVGKITLKTGSKPMVYSDIKFSGSLYQSRLSIKHLHTRMQTYSVDASGEFSFSKPFPLSVQADLSDNNGSTLHAQINGEIENYQLSAAASINTPSLPPITTQLQSNGNLNHLDVVQLTAQILENTLIITGEIDWKEKLRIESEFSADNINPALITAELPGNISLTGKASLRDQTLETRFNATGRARDTPVDLEVKLSLRDKIAEIHLAKVSFGKNNMTLKGRLSSKRADNIVYHIDAPDLSVFYPEMGGKITSSGHLHGQWEKLEINSKLRGESIFFNAHQIKSVDLNLQPSGVAGEYNLNILANNIISGERSIESFSIKGEGNHQQQDLQFDIQGGPLESMLSATLSGQLDSLKGNWKGKLNQLHLSATDLPDYHQKQPASIMLSKSRQSISGFCLQGPTEKLCLDSDLNLSNKSIISASLKQLPLKRLSPWIPLSEALTEHASSELTIMGNHHQWQINASGELDPNNRMNALLSFNQDKNTVAGNITANFDKLHWINLFTEAISQPEGHLNANINLTGMASQPNLSGTIKLEEGEARVPLAGTEITNANMLIDLQPDQSAKLSGDFQSGDGVITLQGETRWPEAPHWNTNIHLGGHNFLATNLPVARIIISPNIKIKGSEKGIDISGTLSIPNAKIRIEDLPDEAIKVSSDEHIIGEFAGKTQHTGTPPLLDINADINIRLGAEVNLQGFGLDTGIEGNLKLRERPGKPIQGDGTLNMVEGQYSAYGTELIIEHGTLYFNGPLDAPQMDLRVINPIDGIKVGLEITGSPQQPESRLFSTPAMPETEALAYLLTGKPIDSAGESESGMLVNAAAKLGMKKSANRINDIRAKAGFDTLQLEAGDDFTESELVIGKYLSSKLYLEYVTKLFSDSEVFALRYEFSNKLHLEAESGADSQALDLIYQFEK